MERTWRFRPHDASLVQYLHRTAGIAPVVAQLLVGRGITDAKAASDFLSAKLSDLRDPELLPGVNEAAARIHSAIANKQKITIFGDYDADGMTSTALLLRGLRLLDADVDFYVPNRIREGYGLNEAAIEQIATNDTRLVITVDCGIANIAEVSFAKERGLDVIVTDHHEMLDQLPAADAIVHPALPSHQYPFHGLCGAGVAFKLIWRVFQLQSNAKRVSERLRNFLLSAIGLSALGTIADVVPLIDENRVIVRHGLLALKGKPSIGIEALMRVAGVDKKPALSSDDVAFMLAPRLNAAGRLGKGELAIELLSTDSYDRAEELATHLDELNATRMDMEQQITFAAKKQVQDLYSPIESQPALVVVGDDWHPGVIGIVAGRLSDQFYRPTIALTFDAQDNQVAMGSGRSIPGFNLNQALHHCRDHLVKYGGHAAAVGLRVHPDNIAAFRDALCEYTASQLSAADFVPHLQIDAEAPLPSLTLRTVKQLEEMSPFGQENRRPVLCARSVQLGNEPKRMGRGEKHLTVLLQQQDVQLRAVAFNQGEWADQLQALDGAFDVAYRPVLNEFNGRRNVELQIVDWKPAKKIQNVAV